MRLTRVVMRLVLGVAMVVAVAQPAPGHGVIESSVPKEGSTVKKVPEHVLIQFTEAPTKDTVVNVTDGCNKSVDDSVFVDGDTAHALIDEGEPGRYVVSFRIISTVDGHPTKGKFSFRVAGSPNCGNDQDDEKGGQGPDGGNEQPGDGSARGRPLGAEEDSFPIVPAIVGGAVILILALLARKAVSTQT